VFLQAAPSILYAQGAGAQPVTLGDHMIVSGSMRTRVENWAWFKGDADGDYTYSGSLARLGLSHSSRKRDWQVEIAVPILAGLPRNAIAAGAQGQEGLGATYFAANGNSHAAALFVKQASFRFKGIGGTEQQSIEVGRIEFTEGSEVTPRHATLAVLKRDRIAQRLVGNFGFTHVGRSFDGLHWVVNGDKLTVAVFGGRPTRGVFQVDGWGELDINLFYGALTAQQNDTAEWRLFGVGYSDYRDRVLKTDNRPLGARGDDAERIDIATFGGHYIHVAMTSPGPLDFLLWGAIQTGTWGTLAQRAGAFAAEMGWQPRFGNLAPWIRGGYNYGSGDGDPNDLTHGTFFQILPTPRVYARFPFHGMMNSTDAFGELLIRPTRTFTVRADVHVLRLAKREDLWYLGGGAFQGATFGYTGRPSNGDTALATLYDASADVALHPRVSVTGYYSYAAGKEVIRNIYPAGPNGRLGYIELLVRF
jgi:Alginate export